MFLHLIRKDICCINCCINIQKHILFHLFWKVLLLQKYFVASRVKIFYCNFLLPDPVFSFALFYFHQASVDQLPRHQSCNVRGQGKPTVPLYNHKEKLAKYLDKVREGVQTKQMFLNGHCPDRATGNVVLFFGRQKRHLSAYYGIKFQLKMMMKMVIILMLDDDNAQKSSTTMTLWSKYTPFKYYYLVKKKDQTNRAGVDPPLP